MGRTNEDLIIPVYLNQRIVFDLIAMLQGGISTVTRVSSAETTKGSDDRHYGASFGLSEALSSLLRIGISGDRMKRDEEASVVQRDEERVHTPASLFHRLRSVLVEKGLLLTVDEDYQPSPGGLIEFSSLLKRNAMIQVLETVVGIMGMAPAFMDRPKVHGGKGGQDVDYTKIVNQMKTLLASFKAGNTLDVVAGPLQSGQRVVITLEQEYLNDPTMADLADGYFRVVGKVVRYVPDHTGSVALLRKVPVGAMSKNLLLQGLKRFSTDFQESIEVPELEWEVAGPVIQLIPIAIFA